VAVRSYYYSVVRAVPHPTREESVNIGLLLVDESGTFSQAVFTDLSRVRALNPTADVRSIELFLEGITARLPLHGRQVPLAPVSAGITVSTLAEWHSEFGGQVRVTEPRIALAEEPHALLTSLRQELLVPIRAEQASRQKVIGRADILRTMDTAVGEWNLAEGSVLPDAHVHGRTAEHLVDRVFRSTREGKPAAIAQAISFQALELREVYGARGALIVATEDLRSRRDTEDIVAFALYADAARERSAVVAESAKLFDAAGVIPVKYSDLRPMRQKMASLLFS
jgi:hypothetical protein